MSRRDSATSSQAGEAAGRPFDRAVDVLRNFGEQVECVSGEPARRRVSEELPADLHPDVLVAATRAGIVNLHAFQREAIDLIRSGEPVVLTGGTGSGKSLCYQLPILDRLRTEKAATALYLAPTKALAQDQARRLLQFGARWARPAL
ncbi:MAG: DEAD/DEAH box helicase, partial [Thermoleophilia bacterium]|nr:DEAD/DEAH box helicase [Thermoleophilia bacterium]